MLKQLSELDGRSFDVAVIGAGANGASAAQHLAAAGYTVLLVDKGDFASGSSSRSSRLLHCGSRYLAPGASAWEFVRHPGRFVTACRMAAAAMDCRTEFVTTTPERAEPLTFGFPVYRGGPYSAWQIDVAYAILRWLGRGGVPLDYRRVTASEATKMPLLEHLREPASLAGVGVFREYLFEWPERIVLDAVFDAERLGAVVRNYTSVAGLERADGRWMVTLADGRDEAARPVTVSADVVCNMAGIWIDRVNGTIRGRPPERRITGTKGAHIVVRLPPECAAHGVVTLNREREPFYCVPWRGLHYFGPTETLYEGDPDDIRPTEEEFEFLLAEANHLLPSLNLRREDVIYGWAGVRPLTFDPELPMGARSRELHDLGRDGFPNLFALTAGPVMTHRLAGREVLGKVRSVLAPSGAGGAPDYASTPLPRDPDSPPLTNQAPEVRLADVHHAVEHEYGESLVDVLFRRTGAAWSETMAREGAASAARILGEARGWSEERIAREVEDYVAFIERQYLCGSGS